jgi:hypothetical protein
LAIVLSCAPLVFVIIRAINLDARIPWFGRLGGRNVDHMNAESKEARKTMPSPGILSDIGPPDNGL